MKKPRTGATGLLRLPALGAHAGAYCVTSLAGARHQHVGFATPGVIGRIEIKKPRRNGSHRGFQVEKMPARKPALRTFQNRIAPQ
jgi:hypothetical protein